MARHLLYFQQVIQNIQFISALIYFTIQAGLTCLEVKFYAWEWEEELRKLTLEDVGLGKTAKAFIYCQVSHYYFNFQL